MIGTAGFITAVGIVSAIIFMLSMRADRARDRRSAYADSSARDTGAMASGIGGFSLRDWFSSSSSSSSSSSGDSCPSSSYFSSSDSSCGGGGGGGDSGGGGCGD